jgi:hypothetical protein
MIEGLIISIFFIGLLAYGIMTGFDDGQDKNKFK